MGQVILGAIIGAAIGLFIGSLPCLRVIEYGFAICLLIIICKPQA